MWSRSSGCLERFSLTQLTACSGDRPLVEALQIMNDEGISSIAVVDNHFNDVGNISTTDVKVCSSPASERS